MVGANAIETAKPDGYTIGTSVSSTLFAPYLKKASYDPRKDFTYIIGVMGFTYGVVVRKDAPWKTFQQFLADARANPGKITYGTPGVGTLQHLTMERIAKQQGINWVYVPFRGDPDAINSLLGGHIHAVATTSSWATTRGLGDLRLLVTWGAERSAKLAIGADAAGNRRRYRRSRRLTDLPAQKGLTQRSSRFCTTPSRGAWKTPSLPQRWHD